MSIQWFPGHMTKARRLLEEQIKIVDAVIELRDARIPFSSANPLLDTMLDGLPRLLALTKTDLAIEHCTERFIAYFAREGLVAAKVNPRDNRGAKELLRQLELLAAPVLPRDRASGRALRGARVLVAGIPNVGKSSLINAFCGRAAARTGALPGVTLAKQWITLPDGNQIFDTPGLLWPRLDDAEVAFRLAVTGAVGSAGFDVLDLSVRLISFLAADFPGTLERHFRLSQGLSLSGIEALEALGRKRGCLEAGGKVNVVRASEILLREFREGKMGRVTLDKVPGHV